MSEPSLENNDKQQQSKEKNNETKSSEKIQSGQNLQTNTSVTQSASQSKKEIKNQGVSEQKQQIQPAQQGRDNERSGQINGLTQKQFKRMKKIVMKQYPALKQQYEKLTKNYQILRVEKDQLKGMLETSQNATFQLNRVFNASKIENQNLKGEISTLKQEAEKRKKEAEGFQKKLQQFKKKIEEAEGMAEKVKQLSIIIDMTTKQVEQHKRIQEKLKLEIDKYKELLKCQKQTSANTKVELQKLRDSVQQTFTMKQELVRISTEYKNMKAEKQQLPIMMDKFQHQQKIISDLKEKIQQYQTKMQQQDKKAQEAKNLSDKLEKKINQLNQQKKQAQKKYSKVRCELQETIGQNDALKTQLQEQRAQFEVQKRRYLGQIKTLKVELHNQHEKLKITEWQLSQSKKKQKPAVKLQGVNVMKLSKQDLLNILQEMEMKNQSLKINLDHVALVIHQKDKKIKDQEASIVALVRQITKSYPNYHESQGMQYVEKDIIEIGKSKKSDWGQIVEKVMIENLRLKYSVTALGEQYNHQIRTNKEK